MKSIAIRDFWAHFNTEDDSMARWEFDRNVFNIYKNDYDWFDPAWAASSQAREHEYARVYALAQLVRKEAGYTTDEIHDVSAPRLGVAVELTPPAGTNFPKLVLFQPYTTLCSYLSNQMTPQYDPADATQTVYINVNRSTETIMHATKTHRSILIGSVPNDYAITSCWNNTHSAYLENATIWNDSIVTAMFAFLYGDANMKLSLPESDRPGSGDDVPTGLFDVYSGLQFVINNKNKTVVRQKAQRSNDSSQTAFNIKHVLNSNIKCFTELSRSSDVSTDSWINETENRCDIISCAHYTDGDDCGLILHFSERKESAVMTSQFSPDFSFALVFGHKDGHDYAFGVRCTYPGPDDNGNRPGAYNTLSASFNDTDVLFAYIDHELASFVNPSANMFKLSESVDGDKYYTSHVYLQSYRNDITLQVDSKIFRPVYFNNNNPVKIKRNEATHSAELVENLIDDGKYRLLSSNLAIDATL